MTLVDLPAPVGAAQLVVTSKEACIVDAHEKDKILVRVRAPKEVGCFSQDVSQTEGPWTLKLVGTTVYCFYYDSELRGNWRAELLPRGRDGKSVIVLNVGFFPNRFTDGQKILIIITILLTWITITTVILSLALPQARQLNNLETDLITLNGRISDLRNHLGMRGQPGDVGPPGPQGQPGPPGPPGRPLKEDVKKEEPDVPRFRRVTMDDFKQDLQPQTLELHPGGLPLKTDFPILKPISADCLGYPVLQGEPKEEPNKFPKFRSLSEHLPTADTLEPGTELKPGQEIKLGDYELLLTTHCMIRIIDSKLDSINGYGPTNLNNGQCTLSMQRDGNLVLYHPEKGAVWASRDQFGKHCPLGVTVTKDGKLDCQIKRESPPPLPEVKKEIQRIPPGTTIGAVRYRMGDYQLGLDGCNLMVFGLPPEGDRVIAKFPGSDCRLGSPPEGDRVIAKFPGSDCRLAMQFDGNLVLYHQEKGVLWSSIDQGMSPCKNGMTINEKGFLICV